MKSKILAMLAILLCIHSAVAAPIYAKANPHAIHGYVMLIRLRSDLYLRWKATGKWPDDVAANAALDGHSRYWSEQLRSGRAIFAGGMNGDYWDNVAMIVFEAASQSEAQAIVANDPAVKAYVFQAQVRPFDVAFITNKFGVALAPSTPASSADGHLKSK